MRCEGTKSQGEELPIEGCDVKGRSIDEERTKRNIYIQALQRWADRERWTVAWVSHRISEIDSLKPIFTTRNTICLTISSKTWRDLQSQLSIKNIVRFILSSIHCLYIFRAMHLSTRICGASIHRWIIAGPLVAYITIYHSFYHEINIVVFRERERERES